MIRSISQVEISSVCNLRCKYCPHPKMVRDKQHMTDETFERVLYWVAHFKQQDIHLHHFGESTLHPQFLEYVDRMSDVVPNVYVSSNGVGVTPEMVRGMKDAGLAKLSLSIHRPEVVQKVAEWCIDAGLPYDWASGPLSAPHNWAGQVEGRNSEWAKTYDCRFLIDQACVVLADGRVANCCIDAEGVSSEIDIWAELPTYALKPFILCRTCHQRVPADLFPDWEKEAV